MTTEPTHTQLAGKTMHELVAWLDAHAATASGDHLGAVCERIVDGVALGLIPPWARYPGAARMFLAMTLRTERGEG